MKPAEQQGRVLIIDSDADVADVIYAILTDEGFTVSILTRVESDAIRIIVGQFEPDCVLLDGETPASYGESWVDAVWLAGRARPVPVIMFTSDQQPIRGSRRRNKLARSDGCVQCRVGQALRC
jgi:DNA-binding response OmpR family regulator